MPLHDSSSRRRKAARPGRGRERHVHQPDPSLFFGAVDDSAADIGASLQHTRKAEQLRAAIERVLTRALSCDLHDPSLDDLDLLEVIADPHGYAAVFSSQEAHDVAAIAAKEARLAEAGPLLRLALARGLARKRVPMVRCFVVPAGTLNEGAPEQGEQCEQYEESEACEQYEACEAREECEEEVPDDG